MKNEEFSTLDWHVLHVETVLSIMESGPGGLSRDEARRRLEVFGPNELQAGEAASPPSPRMRQAVVAAALRLSALG